MREFEIQWRAGRFAGVGLTLVLVLAATAAAHGSLRLDLRLAGGGNTVAVTSPTQVVRGIEFWTVIEDGNSTDQDDALSRIAVCAQSSDGGVILGDLAAVWAVVWWPSLNTMFVTPYGLGTGASLGTRMDADGDGDLDIGKLAPQDSRDNLALQPSALNMPLEQRVGREKHIADLTFSCVDWGDALHGVTWLCVAAVLGFTDGPSTYLWVEDGDWATEWDSPGLVRTGQEIILYRPAEADAGGAYEAAPGGSVTFDGAASTGTIDEWLWDFNDDGTTDATGETVAVSFADLRSLYGLAPGVHDVTLTTYSPYTQDSATVPLTVLPESASLALLATGALAATVCRRRRRA
jgi:hypothetical protein